MKTLIVNGSPNKKGDTVHLIHGLTKHLNGEIKVLSFKDNISPCVDCRHCWKSHGCFLNDDMAEVYPYWEECDHFVMASPIWFSTLSGVCLNLASRLVQPYFCGTYFRQEENRIKRKNGVLILTGGEKSTEEGAKKTAHTIFKLANAFPWAAYVFSLSTDKTPAAYDTLALSQARDAALLLNRLSG